MAYIYFYIEAYYAKEYGLVKLLPKFQLEAYRGDSHWEAKAGLAEKVMSLERPRNGEESFYGEYDLRFAKECKSPFEAYLYLNELLEIQRSVTKASQNKVNTRIIYESDSRRLGH